MQEAPEHERAHHPDPDGVEGLAEGREPRFRTDGREVGREIPPHALPRPVELEREDSESDEKEEEYGNQESCRALDPPPQPAGDDEPRQQHHGDRIGEHLSRARGEGRERLSRGLHAAGVVAPRKARTKYAAIQPMMSW